MSASHIYANKDRSQFFDAGLFGTNDSHSCIGQGPGARALALLLADGSWHGCRISIVSDSADEYQEIVQSFTDITIEAELMLIDCDGFHWVEDTVEVGILAFKQLCCFAMHLDRRDVVAFLDARFGAGKWQRRYKKACEQSWPDTWSQRVIDAGTRGLKI